MNKKIIYISVFLILALFLISSCIKPKERGREPSLPYTIIKTQDFSYYSSSNYGPDTFYNCKDNNLDNGFDPLIKGSVTFTERAPYHSDPRDDSSLISEDDCTNEETLVEKECKNSTIITHTTVKCRGYCNGGACVLERDGSYGWK